MLDLTNVSTVARINIDVTRRCNLSCWYCHSTSGPDYRGPEVDVSRIPELFATSDAMKTFDITITGGEPTLWKGLPTLLEASKALEFTSLQLITNATAITDRMVEAIRASNLKRICISLDGPEHIHTRNRGSGMYSRTIDGIKRLKDVLDNITVISVLDNSSFQYWPELTEILLQLGVSQHHLAPVCFAGNAMDEYKGLNEEQFAYVRKEADTISSQVPSDFIVRFNDVLVNGMSSRTIPLQTFIERFKGWHIIVRPDGKVNTNVRVWGRSWRTNETLGNIHETSLHEIIDGYGVRVTDLLQHRFTTQEEVQRKFHLLNVNQQFVQQDVADVRSVESGSGKTIYETEEADANTVPLDNLPLGKDIAALQLSLTNMPSRYRIRQENGFVLLFDTVTFEVSILNETEFATLNGVRA